MELAESGINRYAVPPFGKLLETFSPANIIMVQYRRNRIAGGTYFFTVTLRDRKSALLVEHIGLLRAAVNKTRRERPFTINAWVVLPEHLHAIWTLPPGDADYSARWRSVKGYFSHEIAKLLENPWKNTKGEYQFWQRRFWEHTIRDDEDFSRHADYIHYNPVKHGLVKMVSDWPYSSFHHFVTKGIYTWDWGGMEDCVTAPIEYGE